MKKFFAIICMAMAAIACSKESVPETLSETDDVRTVTLTATLPSTKVNVDLDPENKGKVTWSSDDKIAVYNKAGKKFEFSLKDGADTDNATFECIGFTGEIADIAVFPYEWAGDTMGEINIPEYRERTDVIPAVMASKIEGGDGTEVRPLYFNSLMAIIEFTIKHVPAYACAFKVWSETGAQVWGTYVVNSERNALESIGTGDYSQIVYFPYKTAYGADASVKVYVPVPAYEYTDLAVRVLDGDEDVIEGTRKVIPAKNFTGIDASAYIVMPELNITDMVGNARDKFVKVEGVKWAKGNLRAWLGGNDGNDGGNDGNTAWQTGWNIYENQWESQVITDPESASTKSVTEYTAVTVDGNQQSYYLSKNSGTSQYHHFDHFSWGLLGRAARVHNQRITSQTANFSIVGLIYEMGAELNSTAKRIDDKPYAEDPYSSNALDGTTNLTIVGDLAYWASKGAYKMPTSSQLTSLYNKNGATKANANMKAGYFMASGKKIRGVLFTSSPSWADATNDNNPENEFTLADMESGLFLPSCGTRTSGDGTGNATRIIHFNKWGSYWSGTWGALTNNDTTYDTARALAWSPATVSDDCSLQNGFTIKYNNVLFGNQYVGNCIRPVFIPESERQ